MAESRLPRTPEVGVQRAVYVTHSESDARAAAEEARWNMRVTLSLRNHYERVEGGRAIAVPAPKEPDVDDLLDRFLIIGTPDTCIRQLRRVQELVGISHFNCSFWFGDLEHGRVLRSMIGEKWSPHAFISGRLTRAPAPRARFQVSWT